MSQGSPKNSSTDSNTSQPDKSMTGAINGEKSGQTMSSTRLSNIQERPELQTLNNRLAAYIDRVKSLETNNSKLTQEINSLQEVTIPELHNCKSLLESENTELRNALDQEKKQNIQLRLENSRNILSVKKLKKKLDQASTNFKKTLPYVSKVNRLNKRYVKTLTENKNLKNVNKRSIKELTMEKKYLKETNKKFKIETMERMKAEAKVLSMKENFRSKEEFQNLENERQRLKTALELKQEAVNTTSARLDEMTQKLKDLLATNNDYLEQIAELKGSTENIKIKYISEIQALNQQLIVMQDDMSKKVKEFEDLMDIKKEMDKEINDYRNLLENEERRLSIIPNTSEVGSPTPKNDKLFQHNESEYESSNVITSSSTGDIEISEVCPDGQFIKLYNKGSKKVSLNGFELIRTSAEPKKFTKFKFRRSIKLGAGNILTVWSATASNQIHRSKPGSVVMKTQVWLVNKIMTTVLLNTIGQQIATHELKKECASHS